MTHPRRFPRRALTASLLACAAATFAAPSASHAAAARSCPKFLAIAVMAHDITARGVSCSQARRVILSPTVPASIRQQGGGRERYRNTLGWNCRSRSTRVQMEGAPKGETLDGPSYVLCRRKAASVKYTLG